jgi:hypothetical protein
MNLYALYPNWLGAGRHRRRLGFYLCRKRERERDH